MSSDHNIMDKTIVIFVVIAAFFVNDVVPVKYVPKWKKQVNILRKHEMIFARPEFRRTLNLTLPELI